MFKKVLLISLLALAVILTACNGTSEEPTSAPPPTSGPAETATPKAVSTDKPTATPVPELPTSTPDPTQTPDSLAQVGPDNFPDNVNPLTGEVVAEPEMLNRWPVAVKINLVPRSYYRPPWGLNLADIVYDYYHNDGYSRLHAIFYGKDAELVGAVRSARLLDVDLIRMYKSIFAYGSADERINARLFNAEFSNRLVLEHQSVTCPPTNEIPMCRFDPSGYDLLLTGTAELRAYIASEGVANQRPNLNGMSFAKEAPAGGTGGQEILTRYSSDNYSLWKYDSVTKRYVRLQDAAQTEKGKETFEPLLDRLDESEISASNVVVVMVPHTYFTPPPGEIVEILLSGKGKAYAYRDGQAYEVFWNRPTVDSVLSLTFEDGTPYDFKPGNTWVQVISDFSEVSQPVENTWRFDFLIP